jgi:phosphoenolpyruvate-protein kinase (PTS system EI component)
MGERLLRGLPASPGVAAGPARVLVAALVDTVALAERARPVELERARAALAAAGEELARVAERLRGEDRADEAEIVETGVLMAEDPALAGELERTVLEAGRPAAAALVEAGDALAATIASLGDERLAARADDVRSLGRRAARLAEPEEGLAEPKEGLTPFRFAPVVLVADELGPADVAELGDGVAGVALAGGSPTAHAAIVARGLGIPMVVGLGDAVLDARDGAPVCVDGASGTAALDPSPARLAAARDAAAARQAAAEQARAGSALPSVTRDGHRVRVLANAATPGELATGLDAGAEGVGLLRTELAFLDASEWPGEAAHRRALAPLLGGLAGRTATVRVLDFGGDKTPPFLRGTEERGLALLLAAPDALADQLRAIAAEGAATDLRVLLPLAERATDVGRVRAMLPPGAQIGAMIETEVAVTNAGELAAAADFLSIGTNDLTHAVLATDRFAAGAAAATHDPRVLTRIAAVAEAARAAGRVLEVCGEAASDPVLVPLLIGLGVEELSVGAARVAAVRAQVREIDRRSAARLAQRALGAHDAAAVAALVDQAADAAGERLDRAGRVVPVGPQA